MVKVLWALAVVLGTTLSADAGVINLGVCGEIETATGGNVLDAQIVGTVQYLDKAGRIIMTHSFQCESYVAGPLTLWQYNDPLCPDTAAVVNIGITGVYGMDPLTGLPWNYVAGGIKAVAITNIGTPAMPNWYAGDTNEIIAAD